MRRNFLTVLFVVLAALIAALTARLEPKNEAARKERHSRHKVTIADAGVIASAPVYVALQAGFFEAEGLDVTLRPVPMGKTSLAAVAAGEADFATVGEFPVAMAAFRTEVPAIIATVATTDRDLRIIARKDRQIRDLHDLRNKKVAVVAGTTADFFLDALLSIHGLSREQMHIVGAMPENIRAELVRGDVDAAVMWNPEAAIAEGELGNNALAFHGDGIYTLFWNIATSRETIRRHPDLGRRLLRAVDKAIDYMSENSGKAKQIVANTFNVTPELIDGQWKIYIFDLTLDQSLLVSMSDEARWAVGRNGSGAVRPNYLYFVSTEGLTEVNPAAVTIIR